MTRVLLTGGTGFLATHILELLLKNGHSVVTTVRSEAKADLIKAAFPGKSQTELDFAIVEDVSQHGAFDKAVVSDPPFEAVIHTASPFTFQVTDIKKELLDPAIIGTTSILEAIKKSAPSVKRVVITSSFAALSNPSKGAWPEHTYTEEDWNTMTMEQALSHPGLGYTGSKVFAEKSAWEFVKNEKPNFMLTTICPTLIFGPIKPKVHSLKSLNTSNQLVLAITKGAAKEQIPDIGGYNFVDVRDVALAHVKAIELPESAIGGQRFFLTADEHYNNRKIVDIIAGHFTADYGNVLPNKDVRGGVYPEGGFADTDNKKSKEVLGIKYRSLEESIVDTVNAFRVTA